LKTIRSEYFIFILFSIFVCFLIYYYMILLFSFIFLFSVFYFNSDGCKPACWNVRRNRKNNYERVRQQDWV